MNSNVQSACELEESKGDLSDTSLTNNESQPRKEEPRNESLTAPLQEAFQELTKELQSWLHHLAMSESYEKDIVSEVAAMKDEVKKNNNVRREKIQQTIVQVQLLTAKSFEDQPTEEL